MIRHILVSVLIQPVFPTIKESKLDNNLTRSAHQALLRKQNGVTDALIFVICSQVGEAEVKKAIMQYGFPDVHVIYIEVCDEDLTIHYDDLEYLIEAELSAWLDKNHPAAITRLSNPEYDSLDIWWSGIETTDRQAQWNFSDKYAATLPDTHRKKAGTWLDILSEVINLDESCWSSKNQFSLYAATLCEWLHGFEAASGNSYNHFDARDVCEALEMDDFYLGFLLGQSTPTETIYEVMENADTYDISDIKSYALEQATNKERSDIRNLLSQYFSSDAVLLWALHTAIWPKYNRPAVDLLNEFINPVGWGPEEVAEVMNEWEFVTNGWTDSADE